MRAERNEFYLNKGSILTFSSRAAVDSPLYVPQAVVEIRATACRDAIPLFCKLSALRGFSWVYEEFFGIFLYIVSTKGHDRLCVPFGPLKRHK